MIQELAVGTAVVVAVAAFYGAFFYTTPEPGLSFEIFEGPGLSAVSVEQALNKIDKKIVTRDAATLLGVDTGIPVHQS